MGPVAFSFGSGVAEYSPSKFFQPGLVQPLIGTELSGDSEFDCIAYLNTVKCFAAGEDDAAGIAILTLQQAGVDDCQIVFPAWQLHDVEISGFPLASVPVDAAAEEFQLELPGFRTFDDEASGFPTPIIPYQSENDTLWYAPPYPTYVDDASGFAPVAQFLPPSSDEDSQQFMVFPGSLAAFVPADESGFGVAPTPGPTVLGRSQHLLHMPILPLPLR